MDTTIRKLDENDLPAALRLKEIAGWNQTERDWRVFLSAGAGGNYAALSGGQLVGTAATIRYENRIAWISMVLVDPDFRGEGIGRSLLQAALEGLHDVPCVKLDATPDGKKLYDKLGFVDESTLQRWVRPQVHAPQNLGGSGSTSAARRATFEDLDAIVRLDEQTFGAQRRHLLQSLLEAAPAAFCTIRDGVVAGFCLSREGARAFQIGPVVAEDFEQARSLIAYAVRELAGRAVFIDVPDSQADLTAWLQELGFAAQRPFIRMRRGREISIAQAHPIFAICGPEFG